MHCKDLQGPIHYIIYLQGSVVVRHLWRLPSGKHLGAEQHGLRATPRVEGRRTLVFSSNIGLREAAVEPCHTSSGGGLKSFLGAARAPYARHHHNNNNTNTNDSYHQHRSAAGP